MPLIWRYLLGQYVKVLLLCIASFIAILMTTRLDEIAHFATLGPEFSHILWFILYQVPYILPIALPVSALISSILLIQRLSVSHELTAMRACGLSLKEILTPLLLAGTLLAIFNFYVISELATHAHLENSLLKNELRSINPLLLLHNKHLMKMKGIYFDTMGASKIGETASEVVVAASNKHNNRINLMLAENLNASNTNLKGIGLTLITSLNSDNKERFDHLMIENIRDASTSVSDFSNMVQKKVWVLNNDHLRMPLLLARLKEQKADYQAGKERGETAGVLKLKRKSIDRNYAEIMRRISAAVAAFTFTLLGAAFGISISRQKSNRGIIYVILLAALYLGAFFGGKGADHFLFVCGLLYFVPHLIIITASLFSLNRAARGVE